MKKSFEFESDHYQSNGFCGKFSVEIELQVAEFDIKDPDYIDVGFSVESITSEHGKSFELIDFPVNEMRKINKAARIVADSYSEDMRQEHMEFLSEKRSSYYEDR